LLVYAHVFGNRMIGWRLTGISHSQRKQLMSIKEKSDSGMNWLSAAPLFILLIAAGVAFQPGCSEKTEITFSPPVISSLDKTGGASGDTIVITGSRFNPNPFSNRIVVSPCQDEGIECARLSVPFAGSTTELRALVPDGSFTGSLRVENWDLLPGGLPMGFDAPQLPSNSLPFDVWLNAGDVAKVFFNGASYDYSIETEGGDDYLLILFETSSGADNDLYAYHLSLDVAPGSAQRGGSGQSEDNADLERAPDADFLRSCDLGAKIRKGVEDHLRRLAEMKEELDITREVSRAVLGEGAAPETAEFNVFADPLGELNDPNSYEVVTADLKYEGAYTLLYVDQNTTLQQLTDAEAEDIGMTFDVSIHPTDRNAFGTESDINGDGKVVILLTPVINDMPLQGGAIILGFFNPADLLPVAYRDVTNSMEIFYALVPDPDIGGADWKERSIEAIKGTLAHEFQHMILFNYRVIEYAHSSSLVYMEELWLNEGLSHIAEDLNGFDTDNIGRADLFLNNPGNAKLTFIEADDLQNRGAAFLFLRYLGDRFGEGIYRNLVQSKSVGTDNVEEVIGESFFELFADWSAALYLSGSGITSDERFNYSSIDIRGDFDPLYVIEYNLSNPALDGTQKAMGPEYVLFDASSQVSYELSINSLSLGSMNAVIIRLN
jgi:hypothetical protein